MGQDFNDVHHLAHVLYLRGKNHVISKTRTVWNAVVLVGCDVLGHLDEASRLYMSSRTVNPNDNISVQGITLN